MAAPCACSDERKFPLLTLHGKSHTLAAIVYRVMGVTALHVVFVIVNIKQMLLVQAKVRNSVGPPCHVKCGWKC